MRGLTFELSGRRRQDASARTVKMYRVPPSGRWWPAVGAPLSSNVRPRKNTPHLMHRRDDQFPHEKGPTLLLKQRLREGARSVEHNAKPKPVTNDHPRPAVTLPRQVRTDVRQVNEHRISHRAVAHVGDERRAVPIQPNRHFNLKSVRTQKQAHGCLRHASRPHGSHPGYAKTRSPIPAATRLGTSVA